MRGKVFNSRMSVAFVLVLLSLNLASCVGPATTREPNRNLTGTPASAVTTGTPSTVITTTPGATGTAVLTPNAGGTTIPPTIPAAGLKTARGVFIVTAHNVAIQPATYTNPAVDGIVIRTFWSNVQPAPDRFDWTFIDSQVEAASASGKKVILAVLPGAFTPQWALQGVQSAQFVVDYGFVQGTTVTLPMPWDATYLNRWFAFGNVSH